MKVGDRVRREDGTQGEVQEINCQFISILWEHLDSTELQLLTQPIEMEKLTLLELGQ